MLHKAEIFSSDSDIYSVNMNSIRPSPQSINRSGEFGNVNYAVFCLYVYSYTYMRSLKKGLLIEENYNRLSLAFLI